MQSFHHTYSVNLCFDAVSLKAWFEILSHSQIFFFFPFSGRKTQQMTFSSDYRPEVLTEALVSLGDHVMSHDQDPKSCDPAKMSCDLFLPTEVQSLVL